MLPIEDTLQRVGEAERSLVHEMDTTAKSLAGVADSSGRRDNLDSPVDALGIVGALDTAVAIVTADWRMVLVNRRWELLFARSQHDCLRRDLFACHPFLAGDDAAALLHATLADRVTRHFDVESTDDQPQRARLAVRVAACGSDHLLIEVIPASATASPAQPERQYGRDEENAFLRALARQMAAVADSSQLLDLLCAAAALQCNAAGAAVLRTSGSDGLVVAAAGVLQGAKGRAFPLQGSVIAEVLQTRGIVAVEHFATSLRPLARLMPELRVGPVLAAPLIAHDVPLGVLAVARDEHGTTFSTGEFQRLHVIADHAALAMWKAQLLEQSQAADLAKGRFLATVSHELRTPLTALTGYEELLADEVIGPLTEAQTDVVERMRSVTHHLTVMIEEVLAYSSIEVGHEVVRPTEFLADDLVRAAVAIVEPLARQKKLRIVCELPAEPIRLTSDIDKVRQILVNLAGNAVKFTDRGEVRVVLSRARMGDADSSDLPAVRFAVQDTGSGIEPDNLGRLFRPFSQVDTGLTRRHGGTGLGLYISQRLAGLLGGRIDVESEPGVGSVFALVLPG